MLTDFYLDENIFLDDELVNVTAVNDIVVTAWTKYGRLVHGANPIKIIDAAPPKCRQSWVTSLAHGCVREAEIDEDVFLTKENFDDVTSLLLKNNISSYVIPKGLHDEILQEKLYCLCPKTDIEVFTPSETTISKLFTNGQSASETDIFENDELKIIWQTRFYGLVKYTKKITIIDRYLGKNAFSDIRSKMKCAIECFVQMASTTTESKAINIIIYTSDEVLGRANIVEIQKYLNGELANKPFVRKKISLTMNICKDHFFGIESHDRYIMFDKHVVQMGNGMEIFREQDVRRTSFNTKNIFRTEVQKISAVFSRNTLHRIQMEQ